MNLTNFETNIDHILFSEPYPDNLFKDGIKPYIKDEFRFNHVKRILNNPTNKLIYDIGPYPGTSVYYFGEHNTIIGLGKTNNDFSNKYNQCGHSIVDIDFESQQMPEHLLKKAEIVLLMEVIEHIRQPLNFLKNVNQLLAPGGLLYISTNNFSYIGYILKLLFNKEILDTIKSEDTFYPGHCRYYLLDELALVLEDFGYSILHKNCLNFLPDSSLYKNKFFGKVKNALVRLSPNRYSTHIEILAKRK